MTSLNNSLDPNSASWTKSQFGGERNKSKQQMFNFIQLHQLFGINVSTDFVHLLVFKLNFLSDLKFLIRQEISRVLD